MRLVKGSLGLAVVSTVASGFRIHPPVDWNNNAPNNITWSFDKHDPSEFQITLARVNFTLRVDLDPNVTTIDRRVVVQSPFLGAGDGYFIQFVNISDFEGILAESHHFSVA